MPKTDPMQESRSISEDDRALWEQLKVHFTLKHTDSRNDGFVGLVNIKPEEALRLIKHFVLVTGDGGRFEFSSDFEKIFVQGFNSNGEYSPVHIEAISIYGKLLKLKKSAEQKFHIPYRRHSSKSVVTYQWSSKDEKPILTVSWPHIGNKFADTYILCLDNKNIQYIPKKSEDVEYQVHISNLEPGTRHTIQLRAKLDNEKETYQSPLKHFVVPDGKIRETTAAIDIFEATDELIDNQSDTDEDEEKEKRESTKNIEPIHKRQKLLPCGCIGPHTEFLGIEHYLQPNREKSYRKSYSDDSSDKE